MRKMQYTLKISSRGINHGQIIGQRRPFWVGYDKTDSVFWSSASGHLYASRSVSQAVEIRHRQLNRRRLACSRRRTAATGSDSARSLYASAVSVENRRRYRCSRFNACTGLSCFGENCSWAGKLLQRSSECPGEGRRTPEDARNVSIRSVYSCLAITGKRSTMNRVWPISSLINRSTAVTT